MGLALGPDESSRSQCKKGRPPQGHPSDVWGHLAVESSPIFDQTLHLKDAQPYQSSIQKIEAQDPRALQLFQIRHIRPPQLDHTAQSHKSCRQFNSIRPAFSVLRAIERTHPLHPFSKEKNPNITSPFSARRDCARTI